MYLAAQFSLTYNISQYKALSGNVNSEKMQRQLTHQRNTCDVSFAGKNYWVSVQRLLHKRDGSEFKLTIERDGKYFIAELQLSIQREGLKANLSRKICLEFGQTWQLMSRTFLA